MEEQRVRMVVADPDGNPIELECLAMFGIDGRVYAVLVSDNPELIEPGECVIMRYVQDDEDHAHLEIIYDDDEWEEVWQTYAMLAKGESLFM